MYSAQLQPVTFVAGDAGRWKIDRIVAVTGATLPGASRLEMVDGTAGQGVWSLRGVAGHARYVERHEKTQLDALSPPLGRPEASRAALIPITKSAAWWALPQDERRAIFEGRSRHIADTLAWLPRIARLLHHSRDLGEPFDFLTWFEFAPEHEAAFDELLVMLRAREEWRYVEREVDVRLSR